MYSKYAKLDQTQCLTSLGWYRDALVPVAAAQSFCSYWQLTLIPLKCGMFDQTQIDRNI